MVTSLAQSKDLLIAGIDRQTSDMWWVERYAKLGEKPYTYLSLVNTAKQNTSADMIITTPAWSLSALLKIFKGGEGEAVFSLSKGGYVNGEQNEEYKNEWFALYERIGEDPFYYCENAESAIDAVAKLILVLKKNGIEI